MVVNVRVRLFKLVFLSLAACVLPHAVSAADEACEQFLGASVQTVLTQYENGTASVTRSELEGFVTNKVDLSRIAKFTLGKYAPSVSEVDFERFRAALNTYVVDILEQSLSEAKNTSAEVLGSVDRRATDCVVETVFYRPSQPDMLLLWRVFREDETYRIFDVAIRDAGNTLWVSLELRAQFAALLDQKNGSIETVIQSLQSKTTDLP